VARGPAARQVALNPVSTETLSWRRLDLFPLRFGIR
jgi:hypothetical protein